jgi:hypothetical protein
MNICRLCNRPEASLKVILYGGSAQWMMVCKNCEAALKG